MIEKLTKFVRKLIFIKDSPKILLWEYGRYLPKRSSSKMKIWRLIYYFLYQSYARLY